MWRGRTKVFCGLSLSVDEGESIAILGPNGSGKTTLAQLLTRTLHPEYRSDSYLRIRGKTIDNVWELRRQMGLVSHDLHNAGWDRIPAREVVLSGFSASIGLDGVPFRPSADDHRRGCEVAAMLQVSDLLQRRFGSLSTGQQRQVLLARALVAQPAALILDEPTSGLDLKWSALYLSRLRDLIRRGVSLTLVTHQVHEVPPEVSRVLFIKQGALIADGPPDQLLRSEPLSKLFETPLDVHQRPDGFCFVCPIR